MTLSPRQKEIVTLLSQGYENKGIGLKLGISTHTVNNHMMVIKERLSVRTGAEAVAIALRRGWIE
jgi:DNA-binding NarL/FixJ family response regulator